MDQRIPSYVQNLFWDVRKETIEINRHSKFIIRRVLDFGDAAALNWLRRTYPDAALMQVIKTKRGLTHKTVVFWTNYFALDLENRGV